jgi:hypothetical protein
MGHKNTVPVLLAACVLQALTRNGSPHHNIVFMLFQNQFYENKMSKKSTHIKMKARNYKKH